MGKALELKSVNKVCVVADHFSIAAAEKFLLAGAVDCKQIDVKAFLSGEVKINFPDCSAYEDIIIVTQFRAASSEDSLHQRLMSLLFYIRAIREQTATPLHLYLPFLPYLRENPQSKKSCFSYLFSLLKQQGDVQLYTFHPHEPSVELGGGSCFIDLDLIDYWGRRVRSFLPDLSPASSFIVAPDFGMMDAAARLAKALSLPLINYEKSREVGSPQELSFKVQETDYASLRNVDTALVFDDMIDSGGTATSIGMELKEKRMIKRVVGLFSHPVGGSSSSIEGLRQYFDTIIFGETLRYKSSDRNIFVDKEVHLDAARKILKKIKRKILKKDSLFCSSG